MSSLKKKKFGVHLSGPASSHSMAMIVVITTFSIESTYLRFFILRLGSRFLTAQTFHDGIAKMNTGLRMNQLLPSFKKHHISQFVSACSLPLKCFTK